MNLKLYVVLFSITVSTILLLNSGAVAPVKAVKHIIWKWDGNNFVKVPGALEHIDAGADGTVWVLNSNTYTDNIYKWDGNNFQPVPGYLKQISVGNKDNVWGVVAPSR
jgi:hypothetical protein